MDIFDAIEAIICEGVVHTTGRGDSSPMDKRKAVAVREFSQALLRLIDSHTITGEEDYQNRMEVVSKGVAGALGVLLGLIMNGRDTAENRDEFFEFIKRDANGFADLISKALAALITGAETMQ